MNKSTFSQRLSEIMAIRGKKQADVSFDTNIPKSALSQYLSNKFEAKQDRVYILAKYFNVSEAWLMGYDVPMERTTQQIKDEEEEIDYTTLSPDIRPIRTQKIPMLGSIACGEPIFDEEFDTFIEASADLKCDFCLTCRGDSMINANIKDGDVVFIRKADIVDNGRIAAVMIDGEVTLKRVYYYPEKNKLVLNPENPVYEPFIYTNEELDDIRILGQAVAYMSLVK